MRKWIFLLMIISCFSCKRDPLYYAASDELTLELYVDWSSSDIDPNGVTVMVYDTDGELFRVYPPFSATDTLSLTLPTGEYDIILFNDSDDEHEYIEFTNIDHIDTLTATTVEQSSSKSSEATTVENPNFLATASLKSVSVSNDMFDYYKNQDDYTPTTLTYGYDVTMTRRVYNYFVTVTATGLEYASGTPSIVFEHLSGGYLVGQETVDDTYVKHSFTMETVTYSDDDSTATITAEFSNFGLLSTSDASYTMYVTFTLIDGSDYTETFDVTEQIAEENLSRATSVVDKEISVEISVPVAIGGDSSSSGAFETEVDDWVDVTVGLPM